MDVKTAYLNAPIDCEIYMEQVEGIETPNSDENERLVHNLNKSIWTQAVWKTLEHDTT